MPQMHGTAEVRPICTLNHAQLSFSNYLVKSASFSVIRVLARHHTPTSSRTAHRAHELSLSANPVSGRLTRDYWLSGLHSFSRVPRRPCNFSTAHLVLRRTRQAAYSTSHRAHLLGFWFFGRLLTANFTTICALRESSEIDANAAPAKALLASKNSSF